MLHILLVSALFLCAQQDAAPLAVCGTCAGQGKALLSCEACDGKGKGPCFQCSGPSLVDLARQRFELTRLTDPEKAAELEEVLEKTAAQFQKIEEMPIFGFRRLPGSVRCPASCASGKSVLNRGLECKPCSGKGRIDCRMCKAKGEGPCVTCAGKRKVELPCPECMGRGQSPSLMARAASNMEICAWCSGTGLHDCLACDDDGMRERTCPLCAAIGKRLCEACGGGKKAECRKCSSTGDLSSYMASKTSNNCDACKRKGFLPCKACKSGKVTCETCNGKKAGRFNCGFCFGEKKALCSGCRGGCGRAWIVTGERLLAAERAELGLAHLRVGLRREEEVARQKLLVHVGTGKERKDFERALDRELLGLRKRIQQAEKNAR